METDHKMLRRRTVLSSMLGAGGAAAFGLPASAMPEYPQLTTPAIPVRNPSRVLMIAGGSAGPRLFAGGEHGVIIYSDDGARSWRQAAVPVSTTITSFAFATPQIGWATGGFGVVLGTTDGGATWVKQLDGIQEIALMNIATQALVAAQPDSDTAARATRRAQILTEEGPDKPFLCLLAVSPTEVFAFGTYRFAERSVNGGKDWTDWSNNIEDKVSHNIYDAAAIGGAYYLVAEAGLIFRSTDGGQSFPQLTQQGDATFFGICDTGGGILAYGVAGTMFLSTDGGASWNPPKFAGTANINAVARLGSGQLVAGDAGGGLWLSQDQGRSFSLAERNPLIAVNALQPIGGSRFLVMSDIGVLPYDLSALRG